MQIKWINYKKVEVFECVSVSFPQSVFYQSQKIHPTEIQNLINQ
ncbi:hypothetical protein O59_000939 [Cellvibrio sp. BR]|nr:hypothetical protein O59_000939 [Cellvibrio sp. BR]